MKRNIAEKLINDFMTCYQALESAEIIAKKIESPEEQVMIIKSILTTAAELEEGMMLLVVRQYPDLNPFSDVRPRTF